MTVADAPGPKGRVILAKAGLDAHERGVHVVARGLRDAGFEVIYLGLRRSPEQIVAAAIDEDADAIGLSSLAGGHMRFARLVLERLAGVEAPPLVVVGGLVSDPEEARLREMGVDAVFKVETPIAAIVAELAAAVAERRSAIHA
jgi:methylmalonyl-CoA mutase, C-terminal domain